MLIAVFDIWLCHKSRSCEERDGRGFEPLLEQFFIQQKSHQFTFNRVEKEKKKREINCNMT